MTRREWEYDGHALHAVEQSAIIMGERRWLCMPNDMLVFGYGHAPPGNAQRCAECLEIIAAARLQERARR